MPNTLAHIAVQGVANATWQPARYLPWVLLGCILPDVPWIASRAIRFVDPGIDVVALDLYNTVQATWLFSTLLGIAFAAFARRPVVVGALLAANVLLHLLVDAVEIKPGSGVHLLAPFSWQSLSFDLVWPEHPLIGAATLLGVAAALVIIGAQHVRFRDEKLVFSARRIGVAIAALTAYLVLPLMLSGGPWDADYRSIRTLSLSEIFVGNPIELDRDPIVVRDGEAFVQVYGREFRLLIEQELEGGEIVSLVGHLAAPNAIRADDVHVNLSGLRNAASIVGLLAIAVVWIRLLATSLGRPDRS
jgi:hypothetical protein